MPSKKRFLKIILLKARKILSMIQFSIFFRIRKGVRTGGVSGTWPNFPSYQGKHFLGKCLPTNLYIIHQIFRFEYIENSSTISS